MADHLFMAAAGCCSNHDNDHTMLRSVILS